MVTPGLRATADEEVDETKTAARLGSGDVPVYATPMLLALVERAAVAAVAGALDPGSTSVGTRVELDHEAPTPIGAHVTAAVELQTVDAGRLRFTFRVADESGPVAKGTHDRMIVDRDRFLGGARRRARP